MKVIPDSVSRFAWGSVRSLKAKSPTIMVVAGVVGFGATAVMAARATKHLEPVIAEHAKSRAEIQYASLPQREEQKALLSIYTDTALKLGRVYGPTLAVGTLSAASILSGHKILVGRHVATMAAYSGLLQEFQSYRHRVIKTLGAERERDIYDGAHLIHKEDPDHPGEYKLEAEYPESSDPDSYLRPWFDDKSPSFGNHWESNYLFLKGVQAHMNRLLQIRKHVFINDVTDALGLPRTREGQVAGWVYQNGGDDFIDFGFMSGQDPHTVAFRNGEVNTVRLNFNIDSGMIWDKI